MTHEVYHDPAQLRAYIVERYGVILTNGGSGTIYARALNLAKHLARLTSEDLFSTIENIQDDYTILTEFEEFIEHGTIH